jgi:hypothetical protein
LISSGFQSVPGAGSANILCAYPVVRDSASREKTHFVLKVNPYQYVLCEIPVSLEVQPNDKISLQFQYGYIFPKGQNYFAEAFFETTGTNGSAPTDGIFSYRNSPFINNGFSCKFEIRNNLRRFHMAPQIMIKHYYFSHKYFPIYGGGVTLPREESRKSTVVGLGIMIGRQYYSGILAYEWYTGIGIRAKGMTSTIHKVVYPTGQTRIINTTETDSSFYPFFNLGARIGIRL